MVVYGHGDFVECHGQVAILRILQPGLSTGVNRSDR